MTFGAFIIGDEIIRGKRPDKHFAQAIHILGTHGLIIDWCEYIGDNPRQITQALARTLASGDIVFSFGGIGATPDDHTRRCAAAAAGVPLIRHPEAAAEIEARFGDAAYPKRILMADLPQGSRIIPNPYNRIPGFSIKDHHFLPGFPEMAWPMMEWVLETFYKHLFPAVREIEQSILVFDVGESLLIDLMKENIAQFPQLKLFCLPSMPDQSGRRLELGVRGDAILVRAAIDHLKKGVDVLGYRWSEVL